MSVLQRFGLIWLSVFFAVLLGGCEDFIGPLHERLHEMEEEPEETVDWVGTWSLESIDGVSLNDLFGGEFGEIGYGFADWTFYEDGNWRASFFFEFIGEGIGGSFWMELSGTYTLDGSNYVLNIDMDAPTVVFGDSDPNTGTWRIEDDTLTLTDDYGSVIVFRDGTELWLDGDPGPPEPQESPLD